MKYLASIEPPSPEEEEQAFQNASRAGIVKLV